MIAGYPEAGGVGLCWWPWAVGEVGMELVKTFIMGPFAIALAA